MTVVLVTDSTAALTSEEAARLGVVVVPLQVAVGAEVHEEVPGGATPDLVADALRAGVAVSTSRPAPARFARAYADAAAAGATAVVSVHLSAEVSGTVESARLAARDAPLPVTVVDSRQVGAGTGYAVTSAARVLAGGGSAAEVAAAARQRSQALTSLFYVDTLEHLRRGGRIGAAAALLGGALAVKPLLHLDEGRVAPLERVRTSARALARLEELAVAAGSGSGLASGLASGSASGSAGSGSLDVTVAHLAARERAELLADHLAARLAVGLGAREVCCTEVGAVLGAHVGPGLLAVCVAPRLASD